MATDLATLKAKQRLKLRRFLVKTARSDNPRVRQGYRLTRMLVRDAVAKATGRPLGWVAHLEGARWTGPTAFEITGWAYERGYGHTKPPRTDVWLQCGELRVPAKVEHRTDPEVNAAALSAEFDYANTAFTARFDLSALLDHLDDDPDGRVWVARVRVRGAGRDRTRGFRTRFRLGSVRHLFTHTLAGGVQISPSWRGGLRFRCRRTVVLAHEVWFEGRTFAATVTSRGPELVGASFQTDVQLAPMSCRPVEPIDGLPAYRIEGAVPTDVPALEAGVPLSVTRQVLVHGADGTAFPVSTALDDTVPDLTPGSNLLASATGNGRLTVLDAAARLLVDACTVDPGARPTITLSGRYQLDTLAEPGALPTLVFEGARQLLPVEARFDEPVGGQGRWQAVVPLLVSVWDRPALPPRLGNYVLRASMPDGTRLPVSSVPVLVAQTPKMFELGRFRLRLQTGGGRSVRFRVSPPRRPDELGSFHQRRLRLQSRARSWYPRNAIFFESFYGRAATCNPYAIDREIARRYPQLTRFWGVVDASIPTPEGAITVVRGTKEWWHARSTARYVVANDWLRGTFVPQPFQVVLQTWHGSMLKRIGLDRPNQPPEKIATIRREQAKWDALVSQNHHSTLILESAYAWDRVMLEEGYPRNDPLTPGSPYAGDGAAIRARLGIRPDQKAVLYAPTWRENLTSMVTFLDLEKLSADLGEGYVILLRGHSRTVAFGVSIDDLPGVIDVTTHPEVTELFLAADAMITDYSSVMFDFSVTRRPMIFFVPDMADYRDSLRGVYFDLSEVAPGPVLSTQDEVTRAIRELDLAGERYAAAYDAWNARFNHHDDGHSAERVVRRLLSIRK